MDLNIRFCNPEPSYHVDSIQTLLLLDLRVISYLLELTKDTGHFITHIHFIFKNTSSHLISTWRNI